jgi:hypothetical protein
MQTTQTVANQQAAVITMTPEQAADRFAVRPVYDGSKVIGWYMQKQTEAGWVWIATTATAVRIGQPYSTPLAAVRAVQMAAGLIPNTWSI